MKIRKAIATTLIAATALVGTASAASASAGERAVYLKIELETVQSGDQIFTDGFESGDTSAAGPVYYRYELKDVLVTSYG